MRSKRPPWMTALLLFGVLTSGCSSQPTAPSPSTPPAAHANVTISSVTVVGDARSTGFQYQTVVQLKESAGVSATISSIDLSFSNGSTPLVVTHFAQPISDATNVCPASGTVSTRQLMTTDADLSHPYATTVKATATFSDSTGYTSTNSMSVDVPPVAAPPTQTYSLTGVVTDAATHAPISAARLEAINGANVGNAATTDSTGTYVMAGLVAETFRLRASAPGYNTGEQNVTVPAIPRADFQLQAVASTACAYTVASNNPSIVSWEGGTFNLAITRTSGACSWQATVDAAWITFANSAQGSDSATLPFVVAPASLDGRTGTITVAWNGGSARITVQQGPHPDWQCFVSLSKGPEDFDNVPSAGGTLTVNASVYAVPSGWSCSAHVASTVTWITGGADITGPTMLTFTVAPNPAPGTARTGSITVTTGQASASVGATQR